MKNKTKMYGRLSAILLSTVLMMTALSTAAAEPPKNLIDAFDPTFESYVPAGTESESIPEGKVVLPENNDLFNLTGATLATSGGHDASANCLALTQKGNLFWFRAPVEPAKNYNFSFWMRNSVKDALQLGKCAFVVKNYKNSAYYDMAFGGTSDWDWVRSGYNGYFGGDAGAYGTYTTNNYVEYTFGIKRDEEAANDWRQVTINFSTPPSGVTHVTLLLKCSQADAKLAIDDLSLVETGNKPNRIFNGDFEAIRNDQAVLGVSGINSSYPDASQVEVDSTGNHYLKIDFDGANRINGGIYSKTATLLQGKDCGTRYKVSYKAKAKDKEGYEVDANKPASLQLDHKNGGEFRLGTLTDEWKTYTMYIDATQHAKDNGAFFGQTTGLVWYLSPKYTLYVDDVYSWYDESNIGFYKTLDFNYDPANGDRGLGTTLAALSAYDNMFMTESSVEASSLSALTPDAEGNRTVKVRAHYLPEAKWGTEGEGASAVNTVSFDKTTVTLLAAVYKYEWIESERKYNKTLVGVEIENGTTQNGETIDVVAEVSVPEANEEGVEYKVEAMAWDMNSMKPIIDADKEQRTLK